MSRPNDSPSDVVQPRRIFIIDDEQALTMLLREVFESDGCEVHVAHNGPDAIRLLSSGLTPDLIFLDMHMDGGNGWDFRAQLDLLGVHVPIVVATGDPDPRRCAEEINAVGYLAKPFDLRDLDRLLDKLIVTGTRVSRDDPAA